MRWVAPTEKDTANQTLEKRLWDAADQFRANSGLKAGQYSTPVLGLIFLRAFSRVRLPGQAAMISTRAEKPSFASSSSQSVQVSPKARTSATPRRATTAAMVAASFSSKAASIIAFSAQSTS